MAFGDFHRGRRLRRTAFLRDMVRETELRPDDLIQGYFVVDTPEADYEKPLGSMPGQSQLSVEKLVARVGAAMDMGLRSAIVFGLPDKKDPAGSGAYADDGNSVHGRASFPISGKLPRTSPSRESTATPRGTAPPM